MAEKKKWAPTKMFLQWCLSYLLISGIALTLLLASGYRYLDVLRDNLEYTNGIQLDMTRVWLDQKVKLLRNITAKESSTAAIEAVRQADDYDDIPRYDYYMLTRKISTDVINYGIGDAYFLYFPSTDAIVSNTKYGQSRRFYDLVLEAYDISYEDWMEILKQNLVTTRVFQPVVQGKDSKNYLVLMRPLNITSREPDKAVAVMIVDLEDLFKASDWLNNDTLCINDRNNGVLVANHELPEATENAVTELIKSSGSRKFDEAAHRTSKEEYISIISSTYENWDIAVILKEQAFASKIIDIQKLLAVVVIIYLLLTVAVIANSAAKRYLKLRNIVQVLHRGNAADPEENLTDAFAYIDSRVQKLVQDNVESSDLIELQRTVMLRDQQPTRNAAEILETHESYPIGYWKGSGLSLALDLIAAALAGGRTTRQVGELPLETELSQVFICIDLDSLPDKENIAANVEATLRDMETSTPVEEGRPVHFPGAHMAEVRSDNMENGIPVEEAIWQQVLAL